MQLIYVWQRTVEKMAVDYLSSLNVGSGLNTTQIVDSLIEAEKAPREKPIQDVLDKATVSISELGKLKKEINVFKTTTSTLEGQTGISLSSSDSTAISLNTNGDSFTNEFSHQIAVSQLAASQVIEFSGFSSSSAFVNIDQLDLSFGKWTNSTNFDSSLSSLEDKSLNFTNNGATSPTLTDIRDAINALKDSTSTKSLGLTASIIETDTNTFSLVVKSISGVDNAMQFTSELNGSEVSTLKYDPSNGSISDVGGQTIAAANSIFTLDGVSLTRDTNVIKNVVSGVEFSLNSITTSPKTVAAKFDETSGLTIIQTMVEELNYLIGMINTLTATGSDGEDGGPMEGDLFLRTLKSKLASMTTTAIPGFDDESVYLSNFGVKTELDGTLSLDTDTFKRYFAANPRHLSAITTSGVLTDNTSVTGTVIGDNFTPGKCTFALDTSAGTATLGSDTALGNDGGSDVVRYSSVTGDTTGVILSTAQPALNTNVYVGRSLVNTINNYLSLILSSETGYGDIDSKIETFEDDFEEYTSKLEKLGEDMEAKRSLYRQKFTAMDQAVAGFKETQTFLDNMMAGWAKNN